MYNGIMPDAPELKDGLEHHLWRPGIMKIIPPGLPKRFISQWIQHYFRIHRNNDYAVLYITDGGNIVHRTCLIPPNFRATFMDCDDLQIGCTSTTADYRNKGLATSGLTKALSLFMKPKRRFWYLARENNLPSINVCMNVGFEYIGNLKEENAFGRLVKRYYIDDNQ